MELSEEFEMNRRYFKSICYFYHVYQISCEIIGFEDKNAKKKNRLFEALLNKCAKAKEGTLDIKIYNKIKSYMKEDVSVISQAFELIENKIIESGGEMGDLDPEGKFYIAVQALDYPEE